MRVNSQKKEVNKMEAKCEYLVEEGLTECPLSIQKKKTEILKDWDEFIKSGFSYEKLTDTLYNYLQMCKDTQYDKRRFHRLYFSSSNNMMNLVEYFDATVPPIITREYSYHNINKEMKKILKKYEIEIKQQAYDRQKKDAIEWAREIANKYGLDIIQKD